MQILYRVLQKEEKSKEQELFEVPYMAVSNVKDGYIDWTTVKTVMASQAEIDKYQLKPFDVLMTEGGDPDKVGRGAIIHEPPKNCIHQNHIFRVRLNRGTLLPEYMEQYLQQQKAKRYFLGCAKQTRISSLCYVKSLKEIEQRTAFVTVKHLSAKELNKLELDVPELTKQDKIADTLSRLERVIEARKEELEELDELIKARFVEMFGGFCFK